MSNTYNTELQNRLRAYVKSIGSQATAAENIGINKAIISLYLHSNYGKGSKFDKGNLHNTEKKLEEFFQIQDAQDRQPSRQSPDRVEQMQYVPTSTSEHVYKSIRYCQLEKGISMIYGDAGIGKTMAARKFAKDYPTATVYMRVTPVTGVMSRFIRKLAAKLNIAPSRDIGQLQEDICDKLMGTNIVLIIDEGQELRYSTMEWLRSLCDYDDEREKPGIGIALIGNARMYTRMQGRKEELYAQQFSRSRPQPYRARSCTRKDVELVFPSLVEQGMEAELDFLFKISKSRWAIRSAVKVYTDGINNKDVSLKRLQDIAHVRGIGVA